MAMDPYVPVGHGNARLKFSCTGVPRVIGTSIGIEPVTLAPVDVASTLGVSFNTHIIQAGARLGNSWTFLGVDFYYTFSAGSTVLYEHIVSVGGTQGSPNVPPNCALLVQKRTLFTGRANRGRGFFPAGLLFEPEVSDAGTISSGVMAGLVANFETWREDMEALGARMTLIHQSGTYVNSEGATVTVAPVSPTPLIALVPQALLATQRRRLR